MPKVTTPHIRVAAAALVALLSVALAGCDNNQQPKPEPPQLADDSYTQRISGEGWRIEFSGRLSVDVSAPTTIKIFGLSYNYSCGSNSTCTHVPDVKVVGPGKVFSVSDVDNLVVGPDVEVTVAAVNLVKAHAGAVVTCLSCKVIKHAKGARIVNPPPTTTVKEVAGPRTASPEPGAVQAPSPPTASPQSEGQALVAPQPNSTAMPAGRPAATPDVFDDGLNQHDTANTSPALSPPVVPQETRRHGLKQQ